MLRRYTHKGIRDDSTWARAQAWAVAGYTLMFLCTGEHDSLDVAMRTADWWMAHAPSDRAAFWDFDDPEIPETNRDTSATAIVAASGSIPDLYSQVTKSPTFARPDDHTGTGARLAVQIGNAPVLLAVIVSDPAT